MSGAAARLSMKALIVRPTSEGLTPSVAPVDASAGKLMSMPEYGTAARKPSSSVKANEAGLICMARAFEMISAIFSEGGRGSHFPFLPTDTIGSRWPAAAALTGRPCDGPPRRFLIGDGLADDPEDLGSRIDAGKFCGHLRRALAVGGPVEHGPHRFAQCFLGRFVGCEIDAYTGPRDARIDIIGLVFGQSRGDQRNAKAHGLVDAAIAAIGDEH